MKKPIITKADTSKPNHFSPNTDSVDIAAQSLGISLNLGYADRGLHIQIRHSRNKFLFETAAVMQAIIIKALNEAVNSGQLTFE